MKVFNGRPTGMYVILALLLALLSACATSVPVPEPAIKPELGIEALELTALDLDTVSAQLALQLINAGDTALALSTVYVTASSGDFDIAEPLHMDLDGLSLVPGAATSIKLDLSLSVPQGQEPLVPLSINATIVFASAERGEESLSIARLCDVPRILPPRLRIASIRILKDELINTKLRVDLEVHNPNAFPVSFCSLDYRLYGESRYWASDSIARPFEVLPMETTMARLYMTMNFTDMSRQLLDQVIRLATVRYRLVGQGSIDTGLEFLPQFVLPFDMSGQTEVLR